MLSQQCLFMCRQLCGFSWWWSFFVLSFSLHTLLLFPKQQWAISDKIVIMSVAQQMSCIWPVCVMLLYHSSCSYSPQFSDVNVSPDTVQWCYYITGLVHTHRTQCSDVIVSQVLFIPTRHSAVMLLYHQTQCSDVIVSPDTVQWHRQWCYCITRHSAVTQAVMLLYHQTQYSDAIVSQVLVIPTRHSAVMLQSVFVLVSEYFSLKVQQGHSAVMLQSVFVLVS